MLLPLSPNHGLFGGDGLYSESKIALETLFAKWRSEGPLFQTCCMCDMLAAGWGTRLSLVGAEIGWTRGTGLMNTNDLIAEGMVCPLERTPSITVSRQASRRKLDCARSTRPRWRLR